MKVKFKIRQYAIFIKPQYLDSANIKCFIVYPVGEGPL